MKLVELKTPAAQTNMEAIELLEDWLDRAKRGEIVGVALAGCHIDGSTSTTWTANQSLSGVIAALAILQHRLIADHT